MDVRGPTVEVKKHRIELYAATSKFRCMSCGRDSEKMNMSGNDVFAKSLQEDATTALQLGRSWTEESPYQEELALLRGKATVCTCQAC